MARMAAVQWGGSAQVAPRALPQKGAESGSTFTLAMKMIRFDDLQLFVRTAALGSFSQAAREADLLPGQVAAAVARLERELDLRLFVRTTRSLRLTGEGALYLPYAQEVLATLREGQAPRTGRGRRAARHPAAVGAVGLRPQPAAALADRVPCRAPTAAPAPAPVR
jgi:Bacterial regulatory helix-turn-helix protein, lysR family